VYNRLQKNRDAAEIGGIETPLNKGFPQRRLIRFSVMRLRRITGSLLTLLTLHLNLLGVDFACAKHARTESGGATEHVMPTTASAHMHGAVTTPPGSMEAPASVRRGSASAEVTTQQPPCDVPVQPSCCKALATCSVVFSSGTMLNVAGVLNSSDLVAPIATTTPPSERAAPEPPPPKA